MLKEINYFKLLQRFQDAERALRSLVYYLHLLWALPARAKSVFVLAGGARLASRDELFGERRSESLEPGPRRQQVVPSDLVDCLFWAGPVAHGVVLTHGLPGG